MHIGAKSHTRYVVTGSELVVTKHLKGLGVIVDSSVKMSTQCVAAVKMGNFILGITRTGGENKTASISAVIQV